ncbi:MAG: thermonuclease family protein [Pseudomonadales bacterium]|nr:thermonuclease family protein [Pseudomonadales bacterium]
MPLYFLLGLLVKNIAIIVGFWLLGGSQAYAAVCALAPDEKALAEIVQIADVYDGDTVQLKGGRKIRLIGINTPETAKPDRSAEPLAEQAHRRLLEWQGRQVYLLKGKDAKDRYGRTLGHLFDMQGNNITAGMLMAGLGFPVTFPPNIAYQACYKTQAAYAKAQSLGVWRHPYYRLRDAANHRELKGGFGRFWGKIENVYVAKKAIWIDLYGGISLRVAKKDRDYLLGAAAENGVLKRILAAVDAKTVLQLPHLEFDGWLMDRTAWGKSMAEKVRTGKRKRWQMNIRHENHWHMSISG